MSHAEGRIRSHDINDKLTYQVTGGRPPFLATGPGCFGSFMVKIGRRREKCWGWIFTCMAVIAVQLEVLASLDTS